MTILRHFLSSSRRKNSASRWQQYRQYQSEALRWASENRTLAQECLNIPSTEPLSGEATLQSFEAYMEWRQWKLPLKTGTKGDDQVVKAKSLVSHVLSAPMTVASQLFGTFDMRRHESAKPTLCVLGARSEAGLPVEYWREILVLYAHSYPHGNGSGSGAATPRLDLTIDFVGPDILRRPAVAMEYLGHTLTLRWLYNGTFHEYLQRSQNPATVSEDILLCSENTWDAYILFNPGIGHVNLRKDWEPTLALLLSSKSTVGLTGNTARILFTAHSQRDAMRDADLLANYLLPEFPLYVENPFSSRIEYEDPFQAEHIVRPNHYAYTLIWQ